MKNSAIGSYPINLSCYDNSQAAQKERDNAAFCQKAISDLSLNTMMLSDVKTCLKNNDFNDIACEKVVKYLYNYTSWLRVNGFID